MTNISSNEIFVTQTVNGAYSQYALDFGSINSTIYSGTEEYYTDIADLYVSIIASSLEYAKSVISAVEAEENVSTSLKALSNDIASFESKLDSAKTEVVNLENRVKKDTENEVMVSNTCTFKENIKGLVSCAINISADCFKIFNSEEALSSNQTLERYGYIYLQNKILYKTLISPTKSEVFDYQLKFNSSAYLTVHNLIKTNYKNAYETIKNSTQIGQISQQIKINYQNDYEAFLSNYSNFNPYGLEEVKYELDTYLASSTSKRLYYNSMCLFLDITQQNFINQF